MKVDITIPEEFQVCFRYFQTDLVLPPCFSVLFKYSTFITVSYPDILSLSAVCGRLFQNQGHNS